jgi:hypothetical protein
MAASGSGPGSARTASCGRAPVSRAWRRQRSMVLKRPVETKAHYFIRSKHPWVTLPPGVPAFETLGDPAKAGARERVMAVLAAMA